jgi:hypothetical protein
MLLVGREKEEVWDFRKKTFWDMAEEMGDISKINIAEVRCTLCRVDAGNAVA